MPERNTHTFDYDEAFSRNIGWVSEEEQLILRHKRIAIAGMGGVGGVHLLTLVRMGFTRFHISDMDDYELANFNRQVGASMSTVGKPKAETMAAQARDINPDVEIEIFPHGINETNIEAFLDGVDLFIDGFDFFVLDIRAMVFAACGDKAIPAITAGPIGMGTAYIVFLPGQMTFEQYFRFEGKSREEKYVSFLLGLTPKMLQRRYLADMSRVDLEGQRGPSTAMACQMCAGVAGVEAVKVLLGRGRVFPAPYYHQFDAYRSIFVRRYLWLGNANPLQAIKRHFATRLLGRLSADARPREDLPSDHDSPMERVLDLARWAPSGDNSQPWRFEITGDETARITFDASNLQNPYEYNAAEPGKFALGALLETLSIAATRHHRKAGWTLDTGDGIRVGIKLGKAIDAAEDPLCDYIRSRSVDRRPYSLRALTAKQKAELEASVGPGFRIVWREEASARMQVARLNAIATRIRLLTRSCFEAHRKNIDWTSKFPRTGMPAAAIGLDPLATMLMRWSLSSWRRMQVMGKLLGGVLWSQVQLDFLPGLFSAAHFAVVPAGPHDEDELQCQIAAGRAIQRFWLTAARLGLTLQPGFAPLIFGYYGRRNEDFGGGPTERKLAAVLAGRLPEVLGTRTVPVFLGRIGSVRRKAGGARSLRRTLQELTGNRP